MVGAARRPARPRRPIHVAGRRPQPSVPLDQQAVAIDAQHAALDLVGAAQAYRGLRAVITLVATQGPPYQKRQPRSRTWMSSIERSFR